MARTKSNVKKSGSTKAANSESALDMVQYNHKRARSSAPEAEDLPGGKRRRYGFVCKEKNRISNLVCGLKFRYKKELANHVQEASYHYFELMKLPPEIRVMILRYVVFSKPLAEETPNRWAPKPTLSVLLTCRQLYFEGMYLVLEKVDFLITGRDWADAELCAEEGKATINARVRLRNFQITSEDEVRSINSKQLCAVKKMEMAPLVGLTGPGTRLDASLAKHARQWNLFVDELNYQRDFEMTPQHRPRDDVTCYIRTANPGRLSYGFLKSAQFARHFCRYGDLIQSLNIELFNSTIPKPTIPLIAHVKESLLPLWQIRGAKQVTFGQKLIDLVGKPFIAELQKAMKSKNKDRGDIRDMVHNLEELHTAFDPKIPSRRDGPNSDYFFSDNDHGKDIRENMDLLHKVLMEVDCQATFATIRDRVLYPIEMTRDWINKDRTAMKIDSEEHYKFDIAKLSSLVRAFSSDGYNAGKYEPPVHEANEEQIYDWQEEVYKIRTMFKAGEPNDEIVELIKRLLIEMDVVINRINDAYGVVLADKNRFDEIDI